MKKPSSIRGISNVLSLTTYLYQKIRPVFSLRAVINEFFQEKLKSYLKRSMFKKLNFYENINILQKKGEKNG